MPVWVRLVKGAYWDFETVVAKYRGWPVPVYQQKWQSDDNYERQVRFLMENFTWLRPAFGSHNLRSLAHAVAYYKMPDLERSLKEMDALLAAYPNDPFFHELKGQILFERGRIDESLPAYARAVELAPQSGLIRAAYTASHGIYSAPRIFSICEQGNGVWPTY